MIPETAGLLFDQYLVFLVMCAAVMGGFWFVSPHRSPRTPTSPRYTDPRPLRRKERELASVRFLPSYVYRHYRNPMRVLRRFLGKMSGRQWVKLRKHYNREVPNGAEKFANAIVKMQQAQQRPSTF